jgi:hypothetical protein
MLADVAGMMSDVSTLVEHLKVPAPQVLQTQQPQQTYPNSITSTGYWIA